MEANQIGVLRHNPEFPYACVPCDVVTLSPSKEEGIGLLQNYNEDWIELPELKKETAHPSDATCDTRRAQKRVRKLQELIDREEMKFSHSVQFNAVPDWSSHYISYSNLKKLIYTLEKNVNQPSAVSHDPESSPLLADGETDPDPAFQRALDVELEKIDSFYQLKEREIFEELQSLFEDQENFANESHNIDHDQVESLANSRVSAKGGRTRQSSLFRNPFGLSRPRRASTLSASLDERDERLDSDDDGEENGHMPHADAMKDRRKTYDANTTSSIDDLRTSRELPGQRRKGSVAFEDYSDQAMSVLYDSGITLKKRTISLYVSLCELKSFIQLNKTGFSKALKKYDKTLDRRLKSRYLEQNVSPAYCFQQSTMQHLQDQTSKIEHVYASVVTNGDVVLAKRELRLHLREHVVWERNTVWREMIGIERKAQAANLGIRRMLLGNNNDSSKSRLQGDASEEMATKELSTPVGRVTCPTWLFSSTMFTLIAIIAVFVVLLTVPIMEKTEQQNCLAMLIFVSLLWATEVIPLFVTSLLVPFLCVILQVVRSEDKPHHRLEPKEAARLVFSAMWTPVIMLLLGGFTIAAALSKYHIAKLMATFVISKAGTRPRTVLITNMFVAMIASMWISNVAAPVLCFSIIQPLLRNLPSDSDFSKALILGIALASNIGGAASPIASPQNIIALQNMKPQPSWLEWFFIALPVCIISILLIWVLLLITFQPSKGTHIVPMRPIKDRFTGIQWFISIVTFVTIALWCVTHQLEGVFGDMGVVAIIPIVLFFGTGILTKEDFNNFLWTIIILAAGGLSLGKAVSSSGLLHTIAGGITEQVEHMSLYMVFVVFSALILVVATFISHTVAALIVLPLVQQVGQNMAEPHPRLLVMGSAIMCSAAMGLPTSGFPNMTAIMMEDSQTGKRYLQVKHFLTRGVPASILTFTTVISLGYGLMYVVGF
ncbi:low-affinity phosphate transporter [Agyrium rufum]|nr:low-affinity phosphate transporter [Agyrium rufum]